jgi:hypothetical protein
VDGQGAVLPTAGPLARRVGVPLSLADFDAIGSRVPLLVNLAPSGKYLMEDFYYAGGLPAVLRALGPQRCQLVRPRLIVGPHDPTGRFTWWPARLARAAVDGRPVLAPGTPDRPLQVIDARDLAAWVLYLLDQGAAGAFNAVSPPGAINWGRLLQACAAAAGVQPDLRWVADELLLAHGVGPWMELPLWIPASGPDAAYSAAFMAVPTNRAQAAGLHCRPVGATVADTLAWWQALPAAALASAGAPTANCSCYAYRAC